MKDFVVWKNFGSRHRSCYYRQRAKFEKSEKSQSLIFFFFQINVFFFLNKAKLSMAQFSQSIELQWKYFWWLKLKKEKEFNAFCYQMGLKIVWSPDMFINNVGNFNCQIEIIWIRDRVLRIKVKAQLNSAFDHYNLERRSQNLCCTAM